MRGLVDQIHLVDLISLIMLVHRLNILYSHFFFLFLHVHLLMDLPPNHYIVIYRLFPHLANL